jgi:hypothetical protein
LSRYLHNITSILPGCHMPNGNKSWAKMNIFSTRTFWVLVYWLCCANIRTIALQIQFMAPMAISAKVTSKGPGRKYIHFSPTFVAIWHMATW